MWKCTVFNVERKEADRKYLALNKQYPYLSILAMNTAGIIAGAITGTLLGLFVLAFLVFHCCKKHREKKYEKEVHHEIR